MKTPSPMDTAFRRCRIAVLALVFVTAFGPSARAETPVSVTVAAKSYVDGETIRLSQIAAVTGRNITAARRVGAVVVGRAAAPGKRYRLTPALLRAQLRMAGINPADVDLHCPATVSVERRATTITKAQITAIASQWALSHVPWDRHRVVVRRVFISHPAHLPVGKVSYRLVPPENVDFLKTIPLAIDFRVDGTPAGRVTAYIDLDIRVPVVVAVRPLARFQPLTRDDLTMEKKDLSQLPTGVLTDMNEVVGKRMRRAVDANTVLRSDLIELPPLIRYGDVVTIVAETSGLRITALGKAVQQGRRGDLITVINLDSKKRIFARVKDAQTVEVQF
jgi:flagellar basal body P-ring formation protein FlgA